MAKFLNSDGLTRLVALIKQALGGKKDADLIVTITQSGSTYTSDKTYAEIVAAKDAGKTVLMTYGNVFYSLKRIITSYAQFDALDGALTRIDIFYVKSNGTVERSNTTLQTPLTFDQLPTQGSSNPVWSAGVYYSLGQKQDTLVSGTNIKTVNSTSLLGSGNITIDDGIAYNGNAAYALEEADTVSTALDILDDAVNGKQATLVSGTNIKTINNNSLLGSGDLELDGSDIYYDGAGTGSYSPSGDTIDDCIDSLDSRITALGTPNSISSVTATESQASGGNNVVTIAQTNGTTTTFNVKNGIDGQDGTDGADGADGVSLGEIALVQTTGDSEESVMSQNAVTEYGRKATAEDLDGTSNWIKEKLTVAGWEFGKYLQSSGTTIANTTQNYVVTHIIPVNYNIRGHNLIFRYNNNKNTSSYVCWYIDNVRTGYIVGLNSDNQVSTTVPNNISSYDNLNGLRFTINYNDIPNCYIYDNTAKKYIWRGDEYLYDFIKDFDVNISYEALLNSIISQELGTFSQKTISQKVITEQFDAHDYTDKRYSYVNGCLCNFKFEDYPLFDLREAEGVSLVMDGQNEKISSYNNGPFLVISDGGAFNGSNAYFMFQWYYGTLLAGFVTGWSSAKTGYGVNATGTSYTYRGWAHQVITFDFNTGAVTIYINGSRLVTTTTPNFDKEGFRTLLRSMTDIYVISKQSMSHQYDINTTGIALFPRAISESEVAQIYGSGGDETKGNLIPQEYNAYDALVHVFTEWNVTQHNATATVTNNDNGGKTLTLNSGKTDFFFALKGMSSSTSYYHIIDFDFTILSGSCMFSYVQYSGAQYKQVVTITDSSGNVVNFETTTLTAGNTYHMRCQPSITLNPSDYDALNVAYKFINAEEGTSIWVHEEVSIREAGTPLKFTRDTYKGDYWEMYNGEHLPTSKTAVYNSIGGCSPNYNPYKQSTIIYSSSKLPQFNGQMAVDPTNNNAYVGILNVNGGTWKQINNS